MKGIRMPPGKFSSIILIFTPSCSNMKKLFLSLILLATVAPGFAQADFNVFTFNIRLNTASDSANAWPYRKDFAASQILFHEADIVGVQEAFYGQLTDLKDRLPGYDHIGVGREDGKEAGEFSAILYNTNRFKLLQSATFWLAQNTSDTGAKGWDAAITRIMTWAKFQDKKTKKQFYFFNTHFDHRGKEARKQSALLVLKKVNEIAGKSPAIVTGDFNAAPGDEPIRIITDPQNPLRLTDAKQVSAKPHYGPTGTFTGFTSKEVSDQPIDYVFVKNGVQVLKHATLSQTWGGRFSSDHFPVMASLRIK